MMTLTLQQDELVTYGVYKIDSCDVKEAPIWILGLYLFHQHHIHIF